MIAAIVLGMLSRLGLHSTAPADSMTVTAYLESWHDFYLLAGTAAATLAGLLFVSLSFNMDHLLHATRSHLLGFARNTLLIYLIVLVTSLMMLVPHTPMSIVGLQFMIVGAVLAVLSVLALWRLVRGRDAVFTLRHRVRRGIFPVIGAVLLLMSGRSLLRGQPEGLYLAISAIAMLLSGAVWASWDLLVGVARIRTEERGKG